jgi:probable 2-oxoglutarate dehydrogenase E1 component DHKTD1
VISSSEASGLRKQYAASLEADLARVDEYKSRSEMLLEKWSGLVWPNTPEAEHQPCTGVSVRELKEVAKASVTLPDDFVCSPAWMLLLLNSLEHPLETEATCLW